LKNVTFDIEYLRYRHTISKVHNVDIVWAFDIEVFDIECYARYDRRSDTRYRGGKDSDGRPRLQVCLQPLPGLPPAAQPPAGVGGARQAGGGGPGENFKLGWRPPPLVNHDPPMIRRVGNLVT
jgi:hypothetical protein